MKPAAIAVIVLSFWDRSITVVVLMVKAYLWNSGKMCRIYVMVTVIFRDEKSGLQLSSGICL